MDEAEQEDNLSKRRTQGDRRALSSRILYSSYLESSLARFLDHNVWLSGHLSLINIEQATNQTEIYD